MASAPDEQHDSQLTRESVTASVHHVRFEPTPTQVDAMAAGGPVRLASTHRNYAYTTKLDETTVSELLADLGAGEITLKTTAGPADTTGDGVRR